MMEVKMTTRDKVLALYVEGRTKSEITHILDLTMGGVKYHTYELFKEYGVKHLHSLVAKQLAPYVEATRQLEYQLDQLAQVRLVQTQCGYCGHTKYSLAMLGEEKDILKKVRGIIDEADKG